MANVDLYGATYYNVPAVKLPKNGGGTATFVDVNEMFCSANLSSAGWYRVLGVHNVSGSVIEFYIGRPYNSDPAESHKVTFYIAGSGKSRFLDESSSSNNLFIDKIRCTYSSSLTYFDIHYTSSSLNQVIVSFNIYGRAQYDGDYSNMGLESVSDAPSGETVSSSYSFNSSNSRLGSCDSSNLITSGTIQSTGSLSYTATKPCWVYLSSTIQANSNGGYTLSLNNVTVSSYESGEAVSVYNILIPVPMQEGDTLLYTQTSNRPSSYNVFAMR